MPAVITGDIIDSSSLALAKRQELLNQLFDKLFAALRTVWRRKEQLRAETVQGDAFQIYISEDSEALRVALMIKCFCLAQSKFSENYRFDCRLSIGVGEVTLLHKESLAKSGGVAFDYSGRGLNEISRSGSHIIFKMQDSSWSQTVNMGLALADKLLSHCTPAQSQAVFLKLSYPHQTQEWLAAHLSIGRSAYSQRLTQAGWSALENLLHYYTETAKA